MTEEEATDLMPGMLDAQAFIARLLTLPIADAVAELKARDDQWATAVVGVDQEWRDDIQKVIIEGAKTTFCVHCKRPTDPTDLDHSFTCTDHPMREVLDLLAKLANSIMGEGYSEERPTEVLLKAGFVRDAERMWSRPFAGENPVRPIGACPFCGNAVTEVHPWHGDDGMFYVACVACNADGPTRATAEEARVAWNARKP